MKITRTELREMLWTIGQAKTAKELNITLSKLRVVCNDYDIPLPPREFWYGLTPEIPLPNPELDVPVCLDKKPNPILEKRNKRAEQNSKPVIPCLADYLPYYSADDQTKIQAAFNALQMEGTLSPTPHPEITKYFAYQEKWKGMKKLQPTLKFKTRLRVIDAEVFIFIDQLLKVFETIGARIYSDPEATKIEYAGQTFSLTFKLPSYRNNTRVNLITHNTEPEMIMIVEPAFFWKGIIIIQMDIQGNKPSIQFKSQTIRQHMDESLSALLKRTFVEIVKTGMVVNRI